MKRPRQQLRRSRRWRPRYQTIRNHKIARLERHNNSQRSSPNKDKRDSSRERPLWAISGFPQNRQSRILNSKLCSIKDRTC